MPSSSRKKMAPKPFVFKFQGMPSKSRFQDDYFEIKDTNLGHTNLGEFLTICNKSTKRSAMVSTLIWSGLVNVASRPMLVQSLDLIMTLAQHFLPNERVVKSVTWEDVLDLWPDNIERVFHLPRVDQFIRLTYEIVEMWYRENLK